jgi:DNA-binding NarL/FixJ family response regulator
VILGRALAASGDTGRAIATLESAFVRLDALGAGRARDEAASALRRLAHRIPRRGRRGDGNRTGIEALSGRECEVADLVEQGCTNRTIARALHVSERTVENHLSSIFRKLGVASRTEVARELARAKASVE